MLTYIITGDIHLSLSNNPAFEEDRFKKYIDTLCEYGSESKNIILNGDIFDKPKPLPHEVKLFYWAVEQLSSAYKEVFVIPGNHEEITKTSTWFDYYPTNNFTLLHCQSLKHDDYNTTIHCISHPNIHLISGLDTSEGTNILVSHYRSEITFAREEVDNEMVSRKFDHTILSDIHFRLAPAENIEYTSSPYNNHYGHDVDNGFVVLRVYDDGAAVTEFVHVDLPNRIKMVSTVSKFIKDDPVFCPRHLYRLTLKGTPSQFKELQPDKLPDNVKYTPVMIESEIGVDDDEVVDVFEGNTVIDFEKTIVDLTMELGEFDNTYEKFGEFFLKEHN